MVQLDHQHIIKILAICSGADESCPTYLIMELAPLGQLRVYLSLHKDQLAMTSLILFSYQISSALCYLQSKNLVHRDVAARNILVSNAACVKLADFGLTRAVENSEYYESSRGQIADQMDGS